MSEDKDEKLKKILVVTTLIFINLMGGFYNKDDIIMNIYIVRTKGFKSKILKGPVEFVYIINCVLFLNGNGFAL